MSKRRRLQQGRDLPYDNEELRELCGCETCNCEISLDDYHKGGHTYNLHDQEGDGSNMWESAGLFDEAEGPPEETNTSFSEELLYYGLHVEKGREI